MPDFPELGLEADHATPTLFTQLLGIQTQALTLTKQEGTLHAEASLQPYNFNDLDFIRGYMTNDRLLRSRTNKQM